MAETEEVKTFFWLTEGQTITPITVLVDGDKIAYFPTRRHLQFIRMEKTS